MYIIKLIFCYKPSLHINTKLLKPKHRKPSRKPSIQLQPSPVPLRLRTHIILNVMKQRHRQLKRHRARNNCNIDPARPAKRVRKLRLVVLVNRRRGVEHRLLRDHLAAGSLDAAELDRARRQRAGGGLGVDAAGVVDGFQREGAGGGAREQRGRAVECLGGHAGGDDVGG